MKQRAKVIQALIAAGLMATTVGCGAGTGTPVADKLSLPIVTVPSVAPGRSAAPTGADEALDPNIMAKVTETKPVTNVRPATAAPAQTVAARVGKNNFTIIKAEDLDPGNLPNPFAPETVDRSDGDRDITQANNNSISGNLQIKTAGGGKDVPIDLFIQDPRVANRAKFWGIHSAYDLLLAGRSPFRRWVLKFKLGGLFYPRYFPAYILYWVEQADLLRIPGMSRQYAFLLQMSGITSVPDLARWAFLDQLAIYSNMGSVALMYGIYMPSFDEFKSWVEAARGLPAVIY